MMKNLFMILSLFIGSLSFPLIGIAEMSSTNYSIYADSFTIGGFFSTSTNYSFWDSIGEWSAGNITSTTYEILGGFQAMEKGKLSLIISKNNLNLGSLSVNNVNSDSTNFTISSDSNTGYIFFINSAGPSPITAVTDGEVTAGSEEYGFAISGVNAAFANDRSIVAGRVLASSTVPVVNDLLTMTVKASRTSTTTYGNKSQNIVLNLSGNF